MRSLAASLAPLLIQACDNRLRDIIWFRTDWQRGGAATGKALFDDPSAGSPQPVIIKLPVVERELAWTRRLQSPAGHAVAPRLFASGETLAGYDLAWIVIERFPHGPLGTHWHDDHVGRMAEAAASFYAAAAAFEVDRPPRVEEWSRLVREAEQNTKLNSLADEKRWLAAIKSLARKLPAIEAEWSARPTAEWLHGDLHLANAMSRESLEAGPVCLIDYAEVHCGHWIEDAIYLERQLWARPQRLQHIKPVKAIAAARRARSLAVDEGYPRLATIRRALLAGTCPAFMKSEGSPAYLSACLERLESALAELK
jgi:hypothetical protein